MLLAQDSTLTVLDSLQLFRRDSLNLHLSYPLKNKLPQNIITIPQPAFPLEIDMRTSSYYTPREVQDKLDHIMQRPRSDTFVPIMAMAAFAVNVAAQQLEAAKLFEPEAEDYLLSDFEISILEELWLKSPLNIAELYSKPKLQESQTVFTLQNSIGLLAGKNLIKTRSVNKDEILFFTVQKAEEVVGLIKKALNSGIYKEEKEADIKQLLTRLENLVAQKPAAEFIKND
jgi:predicted transcriptional regulator